MTVARRTPARFAAAAAALAAAVLMAWAGSPASAQDAEIPIALVGPTLLAAGIDQQVLIGDITNPGDVATSYRVEVLGPVGGSPVEVTVPAGQTARFEIPVAPPAATGGVVPIEMHVTADGTVLGISTLDVQVVDLDDPGDREEAEEAVEQIQEDPAVEPEVAEAVEETIEPALEAAAGDDPAPSEPADGSAPEGNGAADDAEVAADETGAGETSDDGGVPVPLVAGIAAGVVVVGGVAALMLRGPR